MNSSNESTWKGIRGVASCGMRQYSHALPAHLRTTSRKLGSMLSGLFGEETARLCLHDGNQIDGLNEILVLCVFRWCEGSLIRLPPQLADVGLHFRVGAEFEENRSYLRCESLGQRFQQAVQIARGSHGNIILYAPKLNCTAAL